jgi:hypothetical protein
MAIVARKPGKPTRRGYWSFPSGFGELGRERKGFQAKTIWQRSVSCRTPVVPPTTIQSKIRQYNILLDLRQHGSITNYAESKTSHTESMEGPLLFDMSFYIISAARYD